MADTLSAAASAYARDDDPELVRLGAPATLKMVEMLLEAQPSHPGLLLTACSGFTQYAHAFIEIDHEILAATDPTAAGDLRERGLSMYARARGYCIRELGTRAPRLAEALLRNPREAIERLETTTRADVPALFWTGAALAGELALTENQLLRLPDLPVVRALLTRALALDETWAHGTVHEAMIAVEGLPMLLGGSAERARQHFDRAVALAGGQSAYAYVTLAASVSLRAGDRPEFERLLQQALAIDSSQHPDLQLANLIAQKRARFLLASADRLFGRETSAAPQGRPEGLRNDHRIEPAVGAAR